MTRPEKKYIDTSAPSLFSRQPTYVLRSSKESPFFQYFLDSVFEHLL